MLLATGLKVIPDWAGWLLPWITPAGRLFVREIGRTVIRSWKLEKRNSINALKGWLATVI